MGKLSTTKLANTWRIMCRSCGKLKPAHAFQDIQRDRTCNQCFQPNPEPIKDLVKHVRELFAKKPGKT
jgi:hypothetical protein